MGMVTGVSLDAMGSSRLDLSQALPSTLSRDGNVLGACARSVFKLPIGCRPQPWVGRRGLPVFAFLFRPPQSEGDGAPKRRMPWITPGRPDCVRASPDRRTLALMTRAPAPLGAPPRHSPQLAFYGGRTCAGPVVPRRGYPAAARVRGCEPRTQVPRPAPPRTTPRPKRPSVDGTVITNSEVHE